jgi:hypothetical protein
VTGAPFAIIGLLAAGCLGYGFAADRDAVAAGLLGSTDAPDRTAVAETDD